MCPSAGIHLDSINPLGDWSKLLIKDPGLRHLSSSCQGHRLMIYVPKWIKDPRILRREAVAISQFSFTSNVVLQRIRSNMSFLEHLYSSGILISKINGMDLQPWGHPNLLNRLCKQEYMLKHRPQQVLLSSDQK